MNKIEAPALDHDKMMAERFGQKLLPRMKIERRVVANLIHKLQQAGFWVHGLNDGDNEIVLEHLGLKPAESLKAVMELAFNLDECWLYVRSPHRKAPYTIYLVFGNDGWDVVCDYSYPNDENDPFRKLMDEFDGEDYV